MWKKEYEFKGDNTLNDFCEWLFSEKNYQAAVLCYNFQGYDSYPILLYLYKNFDSPMWLPMALKLCLS